jgi:hypothetical protein
MVWVHAQLDAALMVDLKVRRDGSFVKLVGKYVRKYSAGLPVSIDPDVAVPAIVVPGPKPASGIGFGTNL